MDYSELKPGTRAMLEAIRDDPEPMPARSLAGQGRDQPARRRV